MKLIRSDAKGFAFHIDSREKRLLCEILKLYPLIPISHHRLTLSNDPADTADQNLLEEALSEQRQLNKENLLAMLAEPNRFKTVPAGFRFSLSSEQMEWLLQVLNDVRVGSWILLGEPDEKKGKDVHLTEENAHYLWSMELAGYFQSILLGATL